MKQIEMSPYSYLSFDDRIKLPLQQLPFHCFIHVLGWMFNLQRGSVRPYDTHASWQLWYLLQNTLHVNREILIQWLFRSIIISQHIEQKDKNFGSK